MVKKCVVCGAIQNKNSPLSFHRFPKNEAICSAWRKACDANHANGNTVVCSKHFLEDDYDDSWPTRKLRKSAIPAPTLRPKTTEIVRTGPPSICSGETVIPRPFNTAEMSISNRSEQTSTSEMESPAGESTPRREMHNVRYIGDLKPADFASPQKAQRHLVFIKKEFESQRKKMKMLNAQKKRLEAKMELLMSQKEKLEALIYDDVI